MSVVEGDSIALESVVYDGHHVGILPDGSAKAPGSTGTGQHGRFVPVVIVEEGVLVSIGHILVQLSKSVCPYSFCFRPVSNKVP